MRIVVKVGTSTLAYATGRLNIRHTEQLVKVLSDLKNEGHEVILVSSGAIGMGVGKLSLPTRPKDTTTKQACAAVGQCELMYTYDRLFNAYNHTVAQILLTGVDVEHTERRVNFQNTLSRLLEQSFHHLGLYRQKNQVAVTGHLGIGGCFAAQFFGQCLCLGRSAVCQKNFLRVNSFANGTGDGSTHVAAAQKTNGIHHSLYPPSKRHFNHSRLLPF